MLLACRALIRGLPYLLIDDATSEFDPEPGRPVSPSRHGDRASHPRLLGLPGLSPCRADRPAPRRPFQRRNTGRRRSRHRRRLSAQAGRRDAGRRYGRQRGTGSGRFVPRPAHLGQQGGAGRAHGGPILERTKPDDRPGSDRRERPTSTIKRSRSTSRALGLIARTAPVGQDLRILITVIEAATDLGRIVDHAVNISEVTLAIGEDPLIKPLIDIPRMAEKAQEMVRHSLDALVRRDVAPGTGSVRGDKGVDALYRELFRRATGLYHRRRRRLPGRASPLPALCRPLPGAGRRPRDQHRRARHLHGRRRSEQPPQAAGDDDGLPHPFLPR